MFGELPDLTVRLKRADAPTSLERDLLSVLALVFFRAIRVPPLKSLKKANPAHDGIDDEKTLVVVQESVIMREAPIVAHGVESLSEKAYSDFG